jgi:rod shape-determining protein MreD
MKYVVYAALALLLVPLQVVLLDRISIVGIRPDPVLIAVCLIGLHIGAVDAIVMGVALGFLQDLFSGGTNWGNLCLKPFIGLLAGLIGRNLVNLTVTVALALLMALSMLAWVLMFLLKSLTGAGGDFVMTAWTIILPQACYDAILGVAALKLLQRWTPRQASLTASPYE